MKNSFSEIYSMLQELSWHFCNYDINGECCGDLSLAECVAMKTVTENEYCPIQVIGNELNFTKSGATKIVNRLESKGYVERHNSPIDGRVCCVSMNDKGREAFININNNYISYIEDLLKEFDPQQVEQIRGVLEMLVKAIQGKKTVNFTDSTCCGEN